MAEAVPDDLSAMYNCASSAYCWWEIPKSETSWPIGEIKREKRRGPRLILTRLGNAVLQSCWTLLHWIAWPRKPWYRHQKHPFTYGYRDIDGWPFGHVILARLGSVTIQSCWTLLHWIAWPRKPWYRHQKHSPITYGYRDIDGWPFGHVIFDVNFFCTLFWLR